MTPRSLGFLLLLISTLLAVDLYSKHWAQVALQKRPKKQVVLVKGYLNLTYVRNPAGAWGLMRSLDPQVRHVVLLLVSFVAVGILLLLLIRSGSDQIWLRVALACILAGAIGNIVDRVRWRYVVDFIDWHRWFRWPTFNVADIAITVGVLMLAVEIFINREETGPSPSSQNELSEAHQQDP